MKNGKLLMAAVAAGLLSSSGVVLGEDKPPDCTRAGTPQMVEGQVTKVDVNQGRIALLTADGTVHEFQASKETLEGYKIGDPIKAKLRTAPNCN